MTRNLRQGAAQSRQRDRKRPADGQWRTKVVVCCVITYLGFAATAGDIEFLAAGSDAWAIGFATFDALLMTAGIVLTVRR